MLFEYLLTKAGSIRDCNFVVKPRAPIDLVLLLQISNISKWQQQTAPKTQGYPYTKSVY